MMVVKDDVSTSNILFETILVTRVSQTWWSVISVEVVTGCKSTHSWGNSLGYLCDDDDVMMWQLNLKESGMSELSKQMKNNVVKTKSEVWI